jgi:hypothetical protein
MRDLHCRGPIASLWNARISFPLERLYQLINIGVWSDLESEGIWESTYPDDPYQLWSTNPLTTPNTQLILRDAWINCAWCRSDTPLDMDLFHHMYTSNARMFQCSSCGHDFNAESLSAQNLKNDLKGFAATMEKWYVLAGHGLNDLGK